MQCHHAPFKFEHKSITEFVCPPVELHRAWTVQAVKLCVGLGVALVLLPSVLLEKARLTASFLLSALSWFNVMLSAHEQRGTFPLCFRPKYPGRSAL